jgi:hypothetical protein
VVEIEPDLPEPSTQPAALLLGATDSFLVKRGLLARGVEVNYPEEPVFRGKNIIYAIKECIEIWNLPDDDMKVCVIYGI